MRGFRETSAGGGVGAAVALWYREPRKMERDKKVMMRWRRWWGDSILVECDDGLNWRFLSLIEGSIRSSARSVKMELKERRASSPKL